MNFVYSCELDVTLEVNGTRFNVSHFGGLYAMNQIPRGRCTLAIGRDARHGITPAKLHTNLAKLQRMSRCKVFFQGYGEYAENENWPDKETVIFDGYITGTGLQKSNGNINFVVDMVHWLADLDFSSMLSQYSHASNMSQLTFRSVVSPIFGTGAVGDSSAYMLMQTSAATVINTETIANDLWGQALKPLLISLAQEDHVHFNSDVSACLGEKDGDNKRALAALSRIEGMTGGEGSEYDRALACYTPELSLLAADGGGVPPVVAEAISEAIGSQLVDSMAHQTMWGKLVGELGPQFMFSVIPQPEQALVVPFMPGLREYYCKSILADDYDYVNLSAVIERPLRAVGVWGGFESHTGIFGGRDTPGLLGVGGCYAPKTAETKDGMIRLVNMPAWLNNVAAVGFEAGRTSGIVEAVPASTATTPQEEPSKDIKGNADEKNRDELLLTAKDMYDRWAHAFYLMDVLRGRDGHLSGRLRFDIAPGSSVRVQATSELFLDQEDDLGETLHASVAGVSFDINAEQGSAGTGFMLKHVRTAQENEEDATSTEYHPLYQTTFLGAPLIPALGFPDEGSDCCFGDS